MLDKSQVGRTSRPGVNEVEAGAIRKFAEALGDTNPLHHDATYARKAGYGGVVAPPTFPVTFKAGSNVRDGLDMPQRGILHGEQAFEYERPIVAGDRITVVQRIEDIYERDGGSGPMDFVVIGEEGTDATGATVYRARRVVIVRRS
jgi:acyl dehydratase